eukprot:5059987-Pleurochrysis_carterae.AAC.1
MHSASRTAATPLRRQPGPRSSPTVLITCTMWRLSFILAAWLSHADALRVTPIRACLDGITKPEGISRRAVLASSAVLAAGGSVSAAEMVAAAVERIDKENADASLRNAKGAPEKHLPIIKIFGTKITTSGLSSQVEMEVPHVMDADKPHFIEYMWMKEISSSKIFAAKRLRAGDNAPPTLVASLPKGAKVLPLLYCNLHGLWEGKPFTVA